MQEHEICMKRVVSKRPFCATCSPWAIVIESICIVNHSSVKKTIFPTSTKTGKTETKGRKPKKNQGSYMGKRKRQTNSCFKN